MSRDALVMLRKVKGHSAVGCADINNNGIVQRFPFPVNMSHGSIKMFRATREKSSFGVIEKFLTKPDWKQVDRKRNPYHRL
jgi:hypothetical protein